MLTSLLSGMTHHIHEAVLMGAVLAALIFKRDAIRHVWRFKTACVLLALSLVSSALVNLVTDRGDVDLMLRGEATLGLEVLAFLHPGLIAASFLCLVFAFIPSAAVENGSHTDAP